MLKKTKVVSVRLQSLTTISPKCYKATDWQNNSALIPKSVVFGRDCDVIKSDAYWVAEWFARKEEFDLMISMKKTAWYNPNSGNIEPNIEIIIEHHTPEKKEPITDNTIQRLKT